jgi:uncharacterized SAM-binding protein YcdF (DUF218 family)
VRGGRPSTTLRHRILGALAWAEAHPDGLLLPTGGIGADEDEAEAVVAARVLIEAGIAPDRILIEPRGRDTLESVRFCDALLRARGGCRTIACCTSPYHQPRCALLLRLLGYRVVVPPMPETALPRRKLARAVAKEMIATPYDAALLLGRIALGRV